MQFGRYLSSRNGFGPVPIPPATNVCQSDMELVWRIIYDFVNNLTGAEEAAIRQIAPLISIVSLRNGNGSIGVVKEIVYENKEGPANRNNLPVYVIVEFSECEIPEEENLIHEMNSKYVPILVVEDRCEEMLLNKNYSITYLHCNYNS